MGVFGTPILGYNAKSWTVSVFEKAYELYVFRTRNGNDEQCAKDVSPLLRTGSKGNMLPLRKMLAHRRS